MWTYIICGGLHGLYLCINHGWTKLGVSLPKLLAWVMTFFAVIVSWVLFRAATLADAMHILQAMVGMDGIVLPGRSEGRFSWLTQIGIELKGWGEFTYLPPNPQQSLAVLAGLLLCVTLLPNTQEIMQKFKPTWWWAVGVGLLTSVCLLLLNRVSEFLYFQF